MPCKMPSNNRHQRNLVHAVHDSLARRPRNWLTNWSQGCTTPRSHCRAWTKRSGSSTRKALGTAGMSAGPRGIHHAASRRPTKNGHASAPDIMYIHTHTCTHACIHVCLCQGKQYENGSCYAKIAARAILAQAILIKPFLDRLWLLHAATI